MNADFVPLLGGKDCGSSSYSAGPPKLVIWQELEISMNPTFKDLVSLVSAIAWPSVTVLMALAFRREVKGIFRAVTERANKVSGLGIQIELAGNQVTSERLLQASSPDEKAKALRDVEIAKAAAQRFDYWMKNYNHQPGLSHRDELLRWLVMDHGALYVSRDYGVFKALAEVVARMGYDTIPPPLEKEFMLWNQESDNRVKNRHAR
jgi:hypothetical protein